MKTAIVGLPMVGKTSLFTILTGVHEAARVGSLEARVGMTKVPDPRLDALAKIFEPPKITYATVEYLDFPSISKEALRDPSYLASLRVVEQKYRTGPFAGRAHTAVTAICGKVEAELAELSPEEQREYLISYGLTDPGLQRLINATYSLLGLMSFLTAGETEVRAWTIPIHSRAVNAAGAIHSDFEKKFIRAEVINWQVLLDHDGYPGVKEKGLLRLEGKEYIVKDGDVLVIRHS